MWHVYILRCVDGSLYTGIALDIDKRLKEHSAGRGSRCLRGRLPVKLVHKEDHSTRSSALKREAEIKSWPRQEKLLFIRQNSYLYSGK